MKASVLCQEALGHIVRPFCLATDFQAKTSTQLLKLHALAGATTLLPELAQKNPQLLISLIPLVRDPSLQVQILRNLPSLVPGLQLSWLEQLPKPSQEVVEVLKEVFPKVEIRARALILLSLALHSSEHDFVLSHVSKMPNRSVILESIWKQNPSIHLEPSLLEDCFKQESDPEIQALWLKIISLTPRIQSVPFLLQALKSRQELIIVAALEALILNDSIEAVPVTRLQEWMGRDHVTLALMAAACLYQLGVKSKNQTHRQEATRLLSSFLNDPKTEIRLLAVLSIRYFRGFERASEWLLTMLMSESDIHLLAQILEVLEDLGTALSTFLPKAFERNLPDLKLKIVLYWQKHRDESLFDLVLENLFKWQDHEFLGPALAKLCGFLATAKHFKKLQEALPKIKGDLAYLSVRSLFDQPKNREAEKFFRTQLETDWELLAREALILIGDKEQLELALDRSLKGHHPQDLSLLLSLFQTLDEIQPDQAFIDHLTGLLEPASEDWGLSYADLIRAHELVHQGQWAAFLKLQTMLKHPFIDLLKARHLKDLKQDEAKRLLDLFPDSIWLAQKMQELALDIETSTLARKKHDSLVIELKRNLVHAMGSVQNAEKDPAVQVFFAESAWHGLPDDASLHGIAARVYYHLGFYELARTHILLALLEEAEPDILCLLAVALAKMGDFSAMELVSSLEKVLKGQARTAMLQFQQELSNFRSRN